MQGALQRDGGPLAALGLWRGAAVILNDSHGANAAALFCTIPPFLFALRHLLLGLGVVHHHVARLCPLCLEVPDVAPRIRKLHKALHCCAESLFSIHLAHELHKAKATRLSRRFVDDKVHTLDSAEL